jgi:phosphoenolpyruvate carboxykinase (ATP)
MTDLADTLKEALRMTTTELPARVDLAEHGIDATGSVYRNPTTSLLYTHALRRGDGRLAEGGPLVVDTGAFTGRSPKDKFLVEERSSRDRIWWGEVNQALSEAHFDGLRDKVTSHLGLADALYVVDAWAGADPAHRLGVRVITAHP